MAKKDLVSLDALLSVLSEPALCLSRRGMVLASNRPAMALLGMAPGCTLTHHVDNLPDLLDYLYLAAASNNPTPFRLQLKDGRTLTVRGCLLQAKVYGRTNIILLRVDQTQTLIQKFVTTTNAVQAIHEELHRERRRAAQLQHENVQLLQVSQRDALTGLLNRRGFTKVAAKAIANADREDTSVAVLYGDLTRFKETNDVYGHEAGDYVLKEVADRIHGHLRCGDSAARFGGDEIVILLTSTVSIAAIDHIVHRMIELIAEPIHYHGHDIEVGINFGVAFCPRDGRQIESLLKAADSAMYQAKRAKRAYCFAGSALPEAPAIETVKSRSLSRAAPVKPPLGGS